MHPACRPFETFETFEDWLAVLWDGDEVPRARLLRAFLTSLHLTMFQEHATQVPSSVWESVPASESLNWMTHYSSAEEEGRELALALSRGAMPRLHSVDLHNFSFEDDESLARVLWALGHTPCAPHLASLDLAISSYGNHRGRRTAAVLGQFRKDRLPSLLELRLEGNQGILDTGVAALITGLTATHTRTRLGELHVGRVGLTDAGMAAVGSLVRAGRCERMTLTLSANETVTDVGLQALTRALEETETQGRPKKVEICDLKNTTLASQEALAAVVKVPCRGCNGKSRICVEVKIALEREGI